MNKNNLKTILIAASACFIFGTGAGIRANYGVMLGAIVNLSRLPYETVSFVIAVAQLMVGIVQPAVGALALKKSNAFVLSLGAKLILVGLIGVPFCRSAWSLLIFLGIVLACGFGALAFATVMGAITLILGTKKAAVISGFVSASFGLGGMVLSPLIQYLIESFGLQTALLTLCVPIGIIILLTFWISKEESARELELQLSDPNASNDTSFAKLLSDTIRDGNYIRIILAYFTCGFYMALIETHLFSQYISYGFAERLVAFAFSVHGIGAMSGCILSGFICRFSDNKRVLGGVYAARVLIILSLILLPKAPIYVYLTAFLFGLFGPATIPPASGLITKLFGPKKLAALFGIAYLVHQVGMFTSSWLGGISAKFTGGYTLVWCLSLTLSAGAALLCFGIRNSNRQTAYRNKVIPDQN